MVLGYSILTLKPWDQIGLDFRLFFFPTLILRTEDRVSYMIGTQPLVYNKVKPGNRILPVVFQNDCNLVQVIEL